MSAASRRPTSARGSITDFQSQIALLTFLRMIDSSGGRLAGFDFGRRFQRLASTKNATAAEAAG
jgi:hypothetical protein